MSKEREIISAALEFYKSELLKDSEVCVFFKNNPKQKLDADFLLGPEQNDGKL